jgi:hypothetical protein
MAYNLPRVKPHVVAAANAIGPKFGIKTVGGWRAVGSVPNSSHPLGLALDFMTNNIPSGKAVGDALAAFAVANASNYGITEVIWYRRIWTKAKGWHAYNGPSSHTDHVHLTFSKAAGDGGAIVPVGNEASNPLIPDSVENAAAFIGDPATWRKLAWYSGGAVCVLIGLVLLLRNQLPSAAVSVASKALKGVSK